MCFWMSYKSSIPLKNLSHCLHWYSLSQCCVNIWSLRINCCECDLSHPLYFYDLSLICALKCILKSLFFEKPIVTLNTLVWFLSNLCWHVVFKTPSCCEFLITLAALIWLLPRLCFQIRKLNICQKNAHWIFIYMCVHACVYVCTCACVYVCMYVCVCACLI